MDDPGPTPAGITGSQPQQDAGQVLASELVYKMTSNSDLVVPRRLTLLANSFFTSHDDGSSSERKRWVLASKCSITPVVRVTKTVRPKKTWTITATVTRKGEQLSLYAFQVLWPRTWSTKGYTTFTCGCKTEAQALALQGLMSDCIDRLKAAAAAGLGRGAPQLASGAMISRRGSADPSVKQTKAAGSVSSLHGDTAADADAATKPRPAPSTGGEVDEGERPSSTSTIVNSQGFACSAGGPGQAGAQLNASQHAHHASTLSGTQTLAQSWDSSDEDEEGADGDPASNARRAAMAERWVPYKQVNGLSVYYHTQKSDDPSDDGGEYLVSAVVHGAPKRVLEVLMHGTTNTTILGPARTLEVLEATRVDDNTTKELVRMTIEAPGWAGVFCAERVVVVERMCKVDENSCYVVMFNSSDDVELRSRAYCGQGGKGTSMHTRQVQVEAGGQVTRRSLWPRAVPCSVTGAYVISCLNNARMATSHECLITCMVKVDLRGACATNSWCGVLCDLFGWREAFLDRILMNVMLVRDEVEHRRFKVQPSDLMTAHQGSLAQAPVSPHAAADGAPAAANGVSLASQPNLYYRSMTMAKMGTASMLAARTTGHVASGRFSSAEVPASAPSGTPPVSTASGSILAGSSGALPKPDAIVETSEGGSAQGATAPGPADVDGEPILDYALMVQLSALERRFWTQTHCEGADAPFSVRGPTYLKDKKKIPAGPCQFAFAAMDVIIVPHVVEHVARFLPSIRSSGMPFGIVINLIIPGTPLLGIVATFATEQHPGKVLGTPPADPMDEGHNWQPFDFVMHKFFFGDKATRDRMIKLIPHIADGSWMIKSAVGTVPVIIGKALKTTYHLTPQYLEVDIDISANNVAAYVTGLVRGATRGLVIDLGFVLEGTEPWELPETLLGTLRLHNLDLRMAKEIDITQELPLVPPRYLPVPSDAVPAPEEQLPPPDVAPISVSGLSGGGQSHDATPKSQPGNSKSTPFGDAAVNHKPYEGGAGNAPAGGRTHTPPPSLLLPSNSLHPLPSPAPTKGAGIPGAQSLATGMSALVTATSGFGPPTTFGKRHRGHARTASNAEASAALERFDRG